MATNQKLLVDLDATLPDGDDTEVVSFAVGGETFSMTKPFPYEDAVGAVMVLQGMDQAKLEREGAAAIVKMSQLVTECIIEMIDDPEANGPRLRAAFKRRRVDLMSKVNLAQMLIEEAVGRPFGGPSLSGASLSPDGLGSTELPAFAQVEGSPVDPAMTPSP